MHLEAFKNTNCIVTGAASGIGLELVKQLSSSHAKVLVVDIDRERLEKLSQEFPNVVALIVCDLSDKSGNELIINWIKVNWTQVDFCFANAGKAIYGPSENQDWKGMDRLFQLNVHSPIQIGFMIRALFPETPFRLIITASAMSYWHIPGYSLYSSTKSALLQWARTIWSEKTGDWVTLVFPISTDTKFSETAGKNIPQTYPTQSAKWVAKSILKGTADKKKRIFPSRLFLGILVLNRFLGFPKALFQLIEYQKHKSWLKKQ